MAKELVFKLKILGSDNELQNIAELKEAIKNTNKELEGTTIGTDEYKKLNNAVAQAKGELKLMQKEQRTQIKAFQSLKFAEGSYRQIQAEVAASTEKLRQLSIGVNATQEDFDRLQAQVQEGKKKLADFNRELSPSNQLVGEYDRGITKAFKDLGLIDQAKAAIGGLEGEQRRLNKRLRELSTEFKNVGEAGERSANEIQSELKGVIEEISKVEKNLSDAKEDFRDVGDVSGNVFNKIKGGLAAIGTAFVAAFTFDKIKDGIVAMKELINEFEELRNQTKKLTGATGEQLDNIVAKVKAVSETFDKDYNEVLIAGNALAKEFGLNTVEAFGLIEKGFLAGADANGEFLDSLREYPAQLRNVGFSAKESIAIITQEVKEGVFSDKGIDSIKEAGNSLRKQTTATRDTLIKAFGKDFTNEILEGINSGEVSILDGIKRISEGLSQLPEQSREVGAVLGEVFKGAGEDAGIRSIKNLKDIDTNLDNLIDTGDKYTAQLIEQVLLEEELAKSQLELITAIGGSAKGYDNLFLKLKVTGINAITDYIEAYKGALAPVVELGRRIGDLIDRIFAFRKEGEETVTFTQILGKAFEVMIVPLRTLIQLFAFLDNTVLDVVGAIPGLEVNLQDIGKGFKDLVSTILQVPAYFSGFLNAAKETFTQIGDVASDTFGNISDLIEGAFTLDRNKVKSSLEKLDEPFRASGKKISDAFNEAFEKAESERKLEQQKQREAQKQREQREEQKKRKEQRKKDIEIARKGNEVLLELTRELVDAELEAMAEGVEKEREIENVAFKRKKEDLLAQLDELNESEEISGEAKAQAKQLINDQIEQLEIAHNKRIKKINKQAAKDKKAKGLEDFKDLLEGKETLNALEVANIQGLADQKVLTEEQANKQIYDKTKERIKGELQLVEGKLEPLQANADGEIGITEEQKQELLQLRSDLNKKLNELDQGRADYLQGLRDQELKDKYGKAEEAFELLNKGTDLLGEVLTERVNREIEEENRKQANAEANIKRLQKELDKASGADVRRLKKKIKEQEKIRDESAKNEEELNTRLARRQKAIAITQAIINGALAVTNILATLIDPTPVQAFKIAAIALAVATTAANVATISSQSFAEGGEAGDPENVQGGNIPSSGIISGQRHGTGGVKFLHRGRLYEAESGEPTHKIGSRRFVFTRGVGKDARLRAMASRLHGRPDTDQNRALASLVNIAGGGAPFGSAKSFMQEGSILGGALPFPQLNVFGQQSDIMESVEEIKGTNTLLEERINQVEANFNDTKIVVPVDEITQVQTDESEAREAGLF